MDALKRVLSSSPKEVILHRKIALLKAEMLGKRLESEEGSLHKSFPPWKEAVVAGKRILLWKELLLQTNYDDMGVVDIMLQGAVLVGVSDCPPCFETRVRAASISESELLDASPNLRVALVARPKSQDAECLEQLQEATKEEVDAGFLRKELGAHRWLAIRRFVIKQGQKHRPIDDALEAHLNDAYTSTIRLRLQDKMETT